MKHLYCNRSRVQITTLFFSASALLGMAEPPSIDSAEEWKRALSAGAEWVDDTGVVVMPKGKTSVIRGSFSRPKGEGAIRVEIQQPMAWDNWEAIPDVAPKGTGDAPVILPVGEGDYYYFARAGKGKGGGYHAFHSTDMKTWRMVGPIASQTGSKKAGKTAWVTTAEYLDGKIYVYYDKPNDGDPHLMVGTIQNPGPDSTISWESKGMVFDDPSHGSDTAIIRTSDGTWHLISEDWSPIDAKSHSWDSPLASRRTSPDGVSGFNENLQKPPVDERTTPTGKKGSYIHPTSRNKPFEYEIHEPAQKAFGDWTAIQIGERYYLFSDYHLAGGGKQDIKIGYFGSDSMDKKFTHLGELGKGHPDPSIGFAEGKFYLMIQRGKNDWVSDGPWQKGLRGRLGVDTTNDGKGDKWTDWQELTESYKHKPGFARVVDVVPAVISGEGLPEAKTIFFEIESTGPSIDRITVK